MNADPRKFSTASSIASHSESSIYYTPTESPMPGTSSGPAPRKCILPGVSKMKEQSLLSLEVNTIGDSSSETLMVPEGGKKKVTASTVSLAGSYGSSEGVGGYGSVGTVSEQQLDIADYDTMYKRFEALGRKWLNEDQKFKHTSNRKTDPNTKSLSPIERVALKGFASQIRPITATQDRVGYNKGVYHNLIPEICVQDANGYKSCQLAIGSDGCFNQPYIGLDRPSCSSNYEGEIIQMAPQLTTEDIIIPSHCNYDSDSINSAVRSFYEEVRTFDYTIIEKCKDKKAPRLRIGMSPLALERLFKTPRARANSTSIGVGNSCGAIVGFNNKRASAVSRASVSEIHWSPTETEYPKEFRSVLSGECVQPMTPNCTIFHGKAMTKTAKVFRTLCLAYAYFIVGMCFSILGPTLLDFAEHIGISNGEAYQFITVRGAGIAVGSVLLGTTIHVLDNYVSFALVLGLCGLANGVFSLLHSLVALMLDEFIIGICIGFLETGTQILCVDIWGYDNTPFMLGIHFFYGVGTIVGPLVAQPFLLNNSTSLQTEPFNTTTTNNESLVQVRVLEFRNSSTSTQQEEVLPPVKQPLYMPYKSTTTNLPTLHGIYGTTTPSLFQSVVSIATDIGSKAPDTNFQYVYFIVGGLFIACGVLKMLIWISSGKWECTQQDKKYLKTKRAKKLIVRDERTVLFLMTIVFMFLHVGVETSYKGFLAPFTVTTLDWSRSFGAWVTSLLYTTYTIGRAIGMIVGDRVDPGTVLWLNLLLMFSTQLVELLTVYQYPFVMWITASLQGLAQSTVLPACFMWASMRLSIKGLSAGVLMFTSSVGMMITPGLTGWLMTYSSPKYFQIIPLCTVIINIINFCIMSLMSRNLNGMDQLDTMEDEDEDRDNFTTSSKEVPDVNGNYIKETTTSTRLSADIDKTSPNNTTTVDKKIVSKYQTTPPNINPIFDNLQIHPTFTGTPQTYKITNRTFGSDVISEIKSLGNSFGSNDDDDVRIKKNRKELKAKAVGFKSPATLLKSPYSMNSYTPLALMTFGEKSFGVV